MSFEKFQLDTPILKAIKKCGYKKPTAIQERAIPIILSGRDLIASANTGTGKTAAFMLPILQRLCRKKVEKKGFARVLVLSPTRELAEQVAEAARQYGRFMAFKTAVVLGGVSYRPQLRALSGKVDLVVGTPGRLLDHLNRGTLDLSKLEVLVLDEADRMLDMGFKRDVDQIIRATPQTRQSLLFTATMDKATTALAKSMMKEPDVVDVSEGRVTVDSIEQHLYLADSFSHKKRLLMHLAKNEKITRAVVFSATKRGAESLARDLRKKGCKAKALHGDMSQAARSRTMASMRQGKVRLLIATDVAARGLDVSDISHVINFDLPNGAQDYVHRIGRTGRAGASGVAISFACGSKDAAQLKSIERFIGKKIARKTVEGLEPKLPLSKPLKTTRSFGPRRKKKRFSFGLKKADGKRERGGKVRIIR